MTQGTEAHRWPDGSRPYEREPVGGWREWVDETGTVHHLGTDGWCWEHSGDAPAWCRGDRDDAEVSR